MTGRVVKMSGPEPARMASMSRESPDVICTGLWIDPQELFHVLVVDEQPRKIEILYFRHQADGRFHGPDFAVDSFAHPFQYPAVFPEAGPQPPPVIALAEPVDVEDPGGFGAQPIAHLEPMLDIVPYVVPAEP